MGIKYFLLMILMWVSLESFSQNSGQQPLSVAANEHTTVSLFFPSTIVKVIPPGVNYRFQYEPGSAIGVLQARKGNKSNLTVITDQGFIYSFALSYQDKIATYTHVLSQGMAIGKTNVIPQVIASGTNGHSPVTPKTNEPITVSNPKTAGGTTDNASEEPVKSPAITTTVANPPIGASDPASSPSPTTTASQPKSDNDNDTGSTAASSNPLLGSNNGEEKDLYDEDRDEYYRIYCENNYLQKSTFVRSFKQNKKIAVRLNNILVDRDEIYIIFQIENNSKKEYKVNGVSFFFKKNEKDPQSIMNPLYTFNQQEIIDPESVNEIVYVFKRLKLKNRERLVIVLDELEDNRMVILPLDSKQINSPTN